MFLHFQIDASAVLTFHNSFYETLEHRSSCAGTWLFQSHLLKMTTNQSKLSLKSLIGLQSHFFWNETLRNNLKSNLQTAATPAKQLWFSLTFWPKQEKKENESDKNIVKQSTVVWRSNSTAQFEASEALQKPEGTKKIRTKLFH